MNTTKNQETDFNQMIGRELPRSMLQSVIDWSRDNMKPDQVFETAELVKFISETKLPGEVFSEDELRQWAIDNGFTPPPKTEAQLYIEKVMKGF